VELRGGMPDVQPAGVHRDVPLGGGHCGCGAEDNHEDDNDDDDYRKVATTTKTTITTTTTTTAGR
jgi:hypothetical protein